MRVKNLIGKLAIFTMLGILNLTCLTASANTDDVLSQLGGSVNKMNTSLIGLIQGPIALTIAIVSFAYLIMNSIFRFNVSAVFTFIALVLLLTTGFGALTSIFPGA